MRFQLALDEGDQLVRCQRVKLHTLPEQKEGFLPLFEAVHLAERYDLAIMSTKGMSNTSARRLVDEMCGDRDLKLLALHDFDKSGLSIFATLREDTRRYTFTNDVEVIDLDLRLADVRQLGLQPESTFDKGSEASRRRNLRQNGATPEEIEFFSALFLVLLIILVL